MNVIEIAIIGNPKSGIEKFYTYLSSENPRSFKGMDFGELKLDQDRSVFIYFLAQNREEYYYLWDAIIPHCAATLVICNSDNSVFQQNIKAINYLEKNFLTPAYICMDDSSSDLKKLVKQNQSEFLRQPKIIKESITDKDSVKSILEHLLSV